MAKVYSGEFGETAGWVLVNDYTIHQKQRLKDRPFMRTRVPKSLYVELSDVQVAEGVEWAADGCCIGNLTVDNNGNLAASGPEKEREEGYTVKRSIRARASFKDTITVFSLDGGAIARFRSLDNVRITPLPRGMVGGKHKATTSDGIGFSGMSSREVPAGGLMEGEPGTLWLDDGKHERHERPATLNGELYLDEEKFNVIFEAIRDGVANIDNVRASIAAELFEGEVQASLSEPWMACEYGMLKKGDWVQTRARLDSIHIVFGTKAEPKEPAADGEDDAEEPPPPVNTMAETQKLLQVLIERSVGTQVETQKLLRVLIKRSGWILAVLVALIVVMVLK